MSETIKFSEILSYIPSEKENMHGSYIGIASCIEGASTLLYNYQYIVVLCVDVPRAKYCSTVYDVNKFFKGEE